ncbi:mechanosensitive ion channel family protein [Sphingomonas profundi]|uniref:mechanosensitive ion channel family protein n=1 Tax=Alterirhizorhabdus profundi TaxID=2681549 RepID=UPI001E45007E|nr:mechanosensitive ion channel domain-containing protein [Sphingomonas profundi]
MDWRTWLSGIGLEVPASPNVDAIVIAVVLVAGAYWIGWFAAGRIAPRMTAAVHRWTGRLEGMTTKLVCAVCRYGITSLLLLIVGNSAALSPIGLMIVAVALGVSIALLSYHIAKAAGLGGATATVLAAIALIAATAGTLGGMRPLIEGLDGVGFTVGKRRLSLLGGVNAVVIVAVLFVVARIVNRILVHSIGRLHALDLSQRVLVQKLAGIVVIVVAGLIGIDLLGIDLTALTVFSGAVGLAVGFGLQKTFGNLIAGLILLMDRSVKPGDVIVVGDTFGAVGKIGVRAVSVVTRDGKEHLIPNEQLMTEPVENWSYSSRNVRIHIPVGVGYGSDLAVAQKLMVEAATAAQRVLAEPKPSVWLKDFGASSVDHDILVWIADPELGVGNVRSDVLNRVWVLFKDNGIEIPFPQQDVHIRSMPEVRSPERT